MKTTISQAKRRVSKLTLLSGALISLFVAGSASADWRVSDQKVQDRLGTGNVNEKLKEMHEQQQVKGAHYNPEGDAEGKSKMAEAPEFEAATTIKDRRCGNIKAADQKAVCDAIVKLEEDRYKYLQDVRKLSEKRAEELQRIYQERTGINTNEPGKLQSNTNRVLTLLTHQRIDEFNLQMAMATFDERLRERREQQTYLADVALDPTKKQAAGFDPGTILGGGAQLLTLHTALEVARNARDR